MAQKLRFERNFCVCRLRLIFPARLQASIVSTAKLNFCVRNGNRWTLCVKITDSRTSSARFCLSACVSVDLSSRLVSKQVLSAQQSLTSVFGMGTGGPFALKTLTIGAPPGTQNPAASGKRILRILSSVFSFLENAIHNPSPHGATFYGWCTSGDSNPGPTD